MNYSLTKLSKIFFPVKIKKNIDHISISRIAFDSRSIDLSSKSLFFCLKTNSNDGHIFIQEAYKKGVRAFVVSKESIEQEKFPNSVFFLVEDTLKALQGLAKYHRNLFSLKAIAITGSNGKTILKEWLAYSLEENYPLIKTPKSYNSKLGVPLSLLEIDKSHEVGIFEVGISRPLEMEKMENLILPQLGILTNVGLAHSQNFPSKKNHILEKLKLFKTCQKLICPIDDNELYEEVEAQLPKVEKYYWGKSPKAHLRLIKINSLEQGSSLEVCYQNSIYNFFIPFRDQASIENSLALFLCLLILGQKSEFIIKKLKHLPSIKMRLELLKGVHDCLIINDTYNSDLYSVKIALELLARQNFFKKTFILSDILESFPKDKEKYQEVATWVNSLKLSKMIAIGENIGKYKSFFKLPFYHFESTKEFLDQMKREDFKDEAILLKGARIFEFEKIAYRLEQFKHDSIYEINLKNLIYNVNYFRSKISPSTKVMAMVKAFSYGFGTYEIANVLQHHKVDYLGVAFVDEGITLREKGISLPIMVMNPEEKSYGLIIQYELEPEIYSFRRLKIFFEELKNKNYQKPYPIHIKVDTGMHRLGFLENEIKDLGNELKKNSSLVIVKSIFSHLASSQDKKEKVFTLNQIKKFEKSYELLVSYLSYKPIRHIVNSAGILNYPEAHFEMIRLGIGMYGVSQVENMQKELKVVGALKTIISQIKKLNLGDTVGYDRKFKAKKVMKLAILPIGYADGLPRSLGNENAYVKIGQSKAKIVGNLCMDMIMVDVTNIHCKEGDPVIVFGEDPTIVDLSKFCGVTSYNLLTNISQRIKRIYYEK